MKNIKTFDKTILTEDSKTREEYVAKIKVLMGFGFPLNCAGNCKTAEEYADLWFKEYPVIGLSCNEIGAWSRATGNVTLFNDLVNQCIAKLAAPEPLPDIVIELTDEYKAFVKENSVGVGCQSITFDKVKEVYQAVLKQEAAKKQ